MDNILSRQESLNLTLPKSVGVVGCGGVGSWTAYFLALAGVTELWLFDSDTVSEHNLNRLPVSENSINVGKSNAVAALIATVRPKCEVYAITNFTKKLTETLELKNKLKWIVATTDTLDSRLLVYNWASKVGVSYIEAAAEGEIGSATGEPAMFSTELETHPGYASVPVWVGPCVSSAMLVVSYVIHNTPMGDRTIRMGWDIGSQNEKGKFEIFDSEMKCQSKTTVT